MRAVLSDKNVQLLKCHTTAIMKDVDVLLLAICAKEIQVGNE